MCVCVCDHVNDFRLVSFVCAVLKVSVYLLYFCDRMSVNSYRENNNTEDKNTDDESVILEETDSSNNNSQAEEWGETDSSKS